MPERVGRPIEYTLGKCDDLVVSRTCIRSCETHSPLAANSTWISREKRDSEALVYRAVRDRSPIKMARMTDCRIVRQRPRR